MGRKKDDFAFRPPQVQFRGNGGEERIDEGLHLDAENFQGSQAPLGVVLPRCLQASFLVESGAVQLCLALAGPAEQLDPAKQPEPPLPGRKPPATAHVRILHEPPFEASAQKSRHFDQLHLAAVDPPGAAAQRIGAIDELQGQIDHVPGQIAVLLSVPVVLGPDLGGVFKMGLEELEQHCLVQAQVP